MRTKIWTSCLPLLLVSVQATQSKPKQGSGIILVKISSILNPEGRDAAGSCCSGDASEGGVCPGTCFSMLRVCASNVKNESVLVIHGGGPKREYGVNQKTQNQDIRRQEGGIRGRNPAQTFQSNSVEYSTRKSGLPVKTRPNSNIQFSEKKRIPPKLSPPKDFKSAIRISPNQLPPNKNIGRRPYIKPNRPINRKVRPPTKVYTNFAIPPGLNAGKTYPSNHRESPSQSRPFRQNQPLPQSRNGLPHVEVQGRENHFWETNEYTVMWREERKLLQPDTECMFGSLKTEVIFNNSLENQGDLLVRLPFYEGWSGVFELTIEVWHIKNPKKIPQLVMQSKKVEEKSIFASILETLTTQLTKTVKDIESKSKSKSADKSDQVDKIKNVQESIKSTEKPDTITTDKPQEGKENTTNISIDTTKEEASTEEKDHIETTGIEDDELHKDEEKNVKDVNKEINITNQTTTKNDTEKVWVKEDGWQVMTNSGKLILRLERDHMIYSGEDWQSSYSISYHSRIDYSIKLSCAKNFTGPTCSFAKICLNKNIKFHKRLSCTEDGQIICKAGWDGPLCDSPICAPGCHQDNGYCKAPGECRCKSGYFGNNCESCVKLLGCSSHGFCNKSYECLCDEGYKGIFCSKPVCKEGCHSKNGFCSQPDQCKCKTGWQGENCTECVPRPGCTNGRCAKPYECNCEEGFRGKLCDKPDCGKGCHQTNGYCSKPGECFCKVGFQGERCDICLPYPGCLNGDCERPWDCNCMDGWMGLKCNELETETFGDGIRDGRCLPVGVFRCMNGGTDVCSWHSNGTMVEKPRCQCKRGFKGKYCQETLGGGSDAVYRTLGVFKKEDSVQFEFPSKLDNSLEKLK